MLTLLVIDGLTVDQCAATLGLSNTATRALAYRARRALQHRYVTQHLRLQESDA